MTPEERNLLNDLFQRLRQAEGQPRDADAERFIRETMQAQPAAPYYMAQSLLVQEHALTAAQQRIAELERQVQEAQQPRPQSSGGSFLGGALGFGRREEPRPAPQAASPWGTPQQPAAYAPQPQPGFRPGPWGGAPGGYPAPPQQGGSFMGGALQTAAGVAGGMLAASAISSLLHSGSSPFGAAAASHGMLPPSETVINNYFGDSAEPQSHGTGLQETAYQSDQSDTADYTMDDGDLGGGGGDDETWI